MMNVKVKSTGFVLTELFITLAVILGLFAIGFPAYRDYMRRDYYKGVVESTVPFKEAVNKCYKQLKMFKGCNSGSHFIPAAINKSKGALAKLNVIDGVIIAAPVPKAGIMSSDSYILTPKMVNDELTWVVSGDGLAHGYTS